MRLLIVCVLALLVGCAESRFQESRKAITDSFRAELMSCQGKPVLETGECQHFALVRLFTSLRTEFWPQVNELLRLRGENVRAVADGKRAMADGIARQAEIDRTLLTMADTDLARHQAQAIAQDQATAGALINIGLSAASVAAQFGEMNRPR